MSEFSTVKVGQSGLNQVAVSNRDFMSTRPNLEGFRSARGAAKKLTLSAARLLL